MYILVDRNYIMTSCVDSARRDIFNFEEEDSKHIGLQILYTYTSLL